MRDNVTKELPKKLHCFYEITRIMQRCVPWTSWLPGYGSARSNLLALSFVFLSFEEIPKANGSRPEL